MRLSNHSSPLNIVLCLGDREKECIYFNTISTLSTRQKYEWAFFCGLLQYISKAELQFVKEEVMFGREYSGTSV